LRTITNSQLLLHKTRTAVTFIAKSIEKPHGLQNNGPKMAASATVIRDSVISETKAGGSVTCGK